MTQLLDIPVLIRLCCGQAQALDTTGTATKELVAKKLGNLQQIKLNYCKTVFMADLTKKQSIDLYNVLSSAGVDCSALKASNPYLPEFGGTPRGKQIRMIIDSANPQLAADLKREAGHEDAHQSLAMAAALAEGQDPQSFSGALAEQWATMNPEQAAQQQQKNEADYAAAMEQQIAEMRFQRVLKAHGGNENAARVAMRIEEEATAKREAQTEANRVAGIEAERRIAQMQAQHKQAARLAGMSIN